MTDNQIEKLIMQEMRKRKITLLDMISGEMVDPDPASLQAIGQRVRQNRFNSMWPSERMHELLLQKTTPELKVSLHDLFRFWWNRCIEKELVREEILEGLYDYFKDKMIPAQEVPKVDLDVDFQSLDLDSAAA